MKKKSAKAELRPGCGGFGIRNFITLFLSIEVTKAMDSLARAEAAGDAAAAAMHRQQVMLFEDQLMESNPVLTLISDAMTAEGEALARGDADEARRHGRRKDAGQEKLQINEFIYEAQQARNPVP